MPLYNVCVWVRICAFDLYYAVWLSWAATRTRALYGFVYVFGWRRCACIGRNETKCRQYWVWWQEGEGLMVEAVYFYSLWTASTAHLGLALAHTKQCEVYTLTLLCRLHELSVARQRDEVEVHQSRSSRSLTQELFVFSASRLRSFPILPSYRLVNRQINWSHFSRISAYQWEKASCFTILATSIISCCCWIDNVVFTLGNNFVSYQYITDWPTECQLGHLVHHQLLQCLLWCPLYPLFASFSLMSAS